MAYVVRIGLFFEYNEFVVSQRDTSGGIALHCYFTTVTFPFILEENNSNNLTCTISKRQHTGLLI